MSKKAPTVSKDSQTQLYEKTRIFYSHRTPKIPGKEGKNAPKNKEFLAGEKNKEFQKNKERKDREVSEIFPDTLPGIIV